MFNLDDCFALMTSRSAKIFAEALERELRPHNVTRAQWIAMYYIYNSKCITQKCLADKMAIKEPTVVRLLQRMEFDGFLSRLSSDEDKRIKRLELTEKGTQIFLELLPIVNKYKNDTVAGVDENDLQVLKDVLDKMNENALKL